jgi:hypothetical protein
LLPNGGKTMLWFGQTLNADGSGDVDAGTLPEARALGRRLPRSGKTPVEMAGHRVVQGDTLFHVAGCCLALFTRSVIRRRGERPTRSWIGVEHDFRVIDSWGKMEPTVTESEASRCSRLLHLEE